MEKLFKRLTELMHAKQLYANPNTTRKQVAEAVNTNEAYLHRTIKFKTGLTFTQYIYQLRLDYARIRFEDPTEINTIETIALEAGYRSRKTFHRHFRLMYGCTPTEYRRKFQPNISQNVLRYL